jgi:hypothetical protein
MILESQTPAIVALALTMCDMHASDRRAIPRECSPFDLQSSAFNLENTDEHTQRQCIEYVPIVYARLWMTNISASSAVFRSERDWISYVTLREKLRELHAYGRPQH